MKNIFILISLLVFSADQILAQLSTRENNDGVFKLSTRPERGDAALTFVLPVVDLSADNGSDAGLYKGNSLVSGDILTFKYYLEDDLAVRAGVRLYADNSSTSGTASDSSDANPISDFEISEAKKKSTMREYKVAGGLEKHFTNSNVFDVYVGGEAIIGLGKDRTVDEEDYFNGDKVYVTRSMGTTIFGLAGVAGFNVFIAELPISLGLEYGISGKWIFGGVTKVKEEIIIDAFDINYSEEWEELGTDGLGVIDTNSNGVPRQYSSAKKREFNMDTNHSVRIVFNIFFGT